jgi:hypothetical protein
VFWSLDRGSTASAIADCYSVSLESPEHTSTYQRSLSYKPKLSAQSSTYQAIGLSLPLDASASKTSETTDRRHHTSGLPYTDCMLPHRSFVEAGIPAMRQYFRLCYCLPATMHARLGIIISQTFRQKTLAGERRNGVELSMHSSVTPYKQYTS